MLAVVACAGGAFAASAHAQSAPPRQPHLPKLGTIAAPEPVNGPWRESLRSAGLLGDSSCGIRCVVRAGSDGSVGYGSGVSLVLPRVLLGRNDGLPRSMNDGALWAGAGHFRTVAAGFRVAYGPVSLLFVPQVVVSENDTVVFRDDIGATKFQRAPVPKSRSPFAWPYDAANSIDWPWRYGVRQFRRADLGESVLSVRVGSAAFGFGTESMWWGPGIRNALLMSNNAAGIPHLFVRTREPVRTRIGVLDARWMLGTLDRSSYFVNPGAGDDPAFEALAARYPVRSFNAAIVAWQPAPGAPVTLGLSRAVYAPTRTRSGALSHPLDIFASTGSPLSDTATAVTRRGRDQITSVFGRYAFPRAGLEAYAELARTELPSSLRDFLEAPNRTLGTTYGVQWARRIPGGALNVQAEGTNVEQGTTFRDRRAGTFYTSRRVAEGYTQRGQVIGAAIGPGASSQFLAIDFFRPAWGGGLFGQRIRWDDDAHNRIPWEYFAGWCEHDVSMVGGVRGHFAGRFGRGTMEASVERRTNHLYQLGPGCPTGPERRDPRTMSLAVSFAPSLRHP